MRHQKRFASTKRPTINGRNLLNFMINTVEHSNSNNSTKTANGYGTRVFEMERGN